MTLPSSIVENPQPPEVPACRVTSANNQASPAIFDFELEDYDTDDMHDNAVNPSRITIQTAGKYHYGANIEWVNPGASGVISMEILLNGATIINKDQIEIDGASGQNPIQGVEGEFEFVVGDFIQVNTNDSFGGVKGLAVSAYSPTFWAHRIG